MSETAEQQVEMEMVFGRLVLKAKEEPKVVSKVKRFGVLIDFDAVTRSRYDYEIRNLAKGHVDSDLAVKDFCQCAGLDKSLCLKFGIRAKKAGVSYITIEWRTFPFNTVVEATGAYDLYTDSGCRVYLWELSPMNPLITVWNDSTVMRITILQVQERD